MAVGAPAGSRPMSGGNKRPDGVANQNAGKKKACQIESWWNHLHLMRPCTVMDKLTNYLRAPIFHGGIAFLTRSGSRKKLVRGFVQMLLRAARIR